MCAEAKLDKAWWIRREGGMCSCGRENCELELEYYEFTLEELKEFQCEEPTISHCPVDEDCHYCFEAEEKSFLAEELEKEATTLAVKIKLAAPTFSYAFNKLVSAQEKGKADSQLIRDFELGEPVVKIFEALGKDLGNLHVRYTDNVVKHHQLQLQIAFLKGDHEAIKSCKALIQSFDG